MIKLYFYKSMKVNAGALIRLERQVRPNRLHLRLVLFRFQFLPFDYTSNIHFYSCVIPLIVLINLCCASNNNIFRLLLSCL